MTDWAGEKGLGRHPHRDPRALLHRMRDFHRDQRETLAVPSRKVWEVGQTLDQGHEGACVGFAWLGWENTKPLGHLRQQGNDYARLWYYEAQRNDPWPGTNYSGTSTSAGAKVAVIRGFAKGFVHAATVEEIITHIANFGPVVMGTNWRRSMDRLQPGAFVIVDLNSYVRGGHAWYVYGYDPDKIYCKNSWGNGYGENGTFYMTHENFRKVFYDDGEAIACVQTGVPPR